MRPSGIRAVRALHRALGRAALALTVIAGWMAIGPSGLSRTAAATPDAMTLLRTALTTMQGSTHNLHAVERVTAVWPGAARVHEGAVSFVTRTGNCATTAQSLTAAFREKSWGTQYPTVSSSSGDAVPVSDWPYPLTGVDSVSDYVVQWRLGHPAVWWTRENDRSHHTVWHRMSSDLGALVARPLCPSSGLFQTHCVGTDCSQVAPTDLPPNLAVVSRESLHGQEVWHLQSVDSHATHDPTGKTADGVVTTTHDYYVARSSQRLLRYVASTFFQSDDPAGSSSTVDEYDYSLFNKPVSIKLPKA